MNKLKNNKSISKIDNNSKTIYSNKGYKCIGPCYPENTIFYNPLGLIASISNYPSCPINKEYDKENDNYIYADECNKKDVNYDFMNYDIFDESVKICIDKNHFLIEVYNIKNLKESINFLNDSLYTLPIYSQKRILDCIYATYSKYNEFPLKIFSEKLQLILKKIYKIKIDVIKIYEDLIKIHHINDNNNDNLYIYFIDKYS